MVSQRVLSGESTQGTVYLVEKHANTVRARLHALALGLFEGGEVDQSLRSQMEFTLAQKRLDSWWLVGRKRDKVGREGPIIPVDVVAARSSRNILQVRVKGGVLDIVRPPRVRNRDQVVPGWPQGFVGHELQLFAVFPRWRLAFLRRLDHSWRMARTSPLILDGAYYEDGFSLVAIAGSPAIYALSLRLC